MSPALILRAGNEAVREWHIAEAGLQLCDPGELRIVDGASHRLHLERPDRVKAAVTGFLSRNENGGG
ncbi:alpha/beta fold hydrolase [Roseomonas elaeocarpi]|uniref:Alpha/beta fold hydrolase n=1 Tax=Roseomonas elaeocarpi TaxID=907779 RepID=A0ABV6JQU4_9PROT